MRGKRREAKDCWSFIPGEGSNQLGWVKPLNIWSRFLAVEELPELFADVVVQQLRPHHRHEHGTNHDCYAHLSDVVSAFSHKHLTYYNAKLDKSSN